MRTLAAVSPQARADGARRHAIEGLRRTAAEAAARLSFADVGALVADRVVAGASLASMSREAGLHKDWLSPSVAARFGFADLDSYLADRRAAGLSWRAIAAECGQPPSWVRRRAGCPA